MSRLRGIDRNLVAVVLLVLLLSPLPQLLGRFEIGLAVRILLFALLATAWNLMSGFAGEFSFGHAAFFGVGAYTSGWLLIHHHLSPWLGMLAGAGLAAALGVGIGLVSFRYRLKGVYFALGTFALAEVLRIIANGSELVNASRGLNVPLLPGASWAMLQFPAGAPEYFYIALGLLASALILVIGLLRSRWGLLILAVRDDADAASAAGIDALRWRLLAIALSAGITGIAGSFWLQYYFFLNPELAFGSALSIEILLPAVVGGVRTIWGPVIGAVAVVMLGQWAAALGRTPPSELSFLRGVHGLDLLIYGAALVVIVIVLPRGLFGLARSRRLGGTA